MNKRTTLAVVLGIGIILLIGFLLEIKIAKNENTSAENTKFQSNELQHDLNVTKVKATQTYVTGEGNQYKIYDGKFFSVQYPHFLEVYENMTAIVPYVIFEGVDDTDGVKTKRAEKIEVYYGKEVKNLTEQDVINRYTATFNEREFIEGDDPRLANIKISWVQGNGYALKITNSMAPGIYADRNTLELK